MKPSLTKYIASSRARLDLNIFTPLFLILTMIAIVNSIQAYSSVNPATASLPFLIRLLLSKLIYSWYFALLAWIVQGHSKRIPLTRKTLVRWSAIHLATLVISFFIHESLSLGADILIWGAKQKATVFYVLFNNPSVWIETLVYILFLLSFSLMEHRRMSLENELKCSQLEVEIIRSKLKEIRSKIQPPFLFASLQTILELVRSQRNKDANHILTFLSEFLRTTVYDTEREEVTLEEELRFLNQYLEIVNLRKRKFVTVNPRIESGILHATVPNFVLQPIVEELMDKIAVEGSSNVEVFIRASKEGEVLEMEIAVHGSGKNIQRIDIDTNGTVLRIITDRLLQLYGNNQELTVQSNSDGGVRVKIGILFREKVLESGAIMIAEGAA